MEELTGQLVLCLPSEADRMATLERLIVWMREYETRIGMIPRPELLEIQAGEEYAKLTLSIGSQTAEMGLTERGAKEIASILLSAKPDLRAAVRVAAPSKEEQQAVLVRIYDEMEQMARRTGSVPSASSCYYLIGDESRELGVWLAREVREHIASAMLERLSAEFRPEDR